jgi:very-long-chain ceramide synthase
MLLSPSCNSHQLFRHFTRSQQWVHRTIYDSVLNTKAFWVGHPHIPLPAPVKFYYLFAFTFYATQTVILHIEEHRKDHLQMFTHHVLTVLLIAGSYATHLTRVGCAILFTLDWCDILLAVCLPYQFLSPRIIFSFIDFPPQLAKMFKYMNVPVMPDITFLVFLVSWLITRQILFPRIVWSVTFDMPVYLPLDWNPAIDHFVTRNGWIFFTVSLWILQALLCIWFYMACKVLYNVIRGKAVEDSRSDDEGEDEGVE